MTPIVPVILSGGAGTRLWPLSRETAPKPFMPLPDGDTLLGKTARRAVAIPGCRGFVTVTNRDLYFHTKDVYAGLADAEPRDAAYLLEPFGRNTAPAVAVASLLVRARYGDDAVMLVLAADHLIRDEVAFAAAVMRGAELAREGRLVTFGITPTMPETGFGYIECGEAAGARAFIAKAFVEKPPLARAHEFVAGGTHVWNSGMFAFTPRVVATIGVSNLVIVDTPDAVLVAHRDHLQRVKEVVVELKARGHDSYKLHKTVARPWGSYTVLEEGPGFKIKRIEVKPGGSLSLQLHHRRSEHWVVLRGTARVTSGESVFDLPTGESTFIPLETMHRLENHSSDVLAIIEVACGDYIEEDDIVRFDDKYGRVPG